MRQSVERNGVLSVEGSPAHTEPTCKDVKHATHQNSDSPGICKSMGCPATDNDVESGVATCGSHDHGVGDRVYCHTAIDPIEILTARMVKDDCLDAQAPACRDGTLDEAIGGKIEEQRKQKACVGRCWKGRLDWVLSPCCSGCLECL